MSLSLLAYEKMRLSPRSASARMLEKGTVAAKEVSIALFDKVPAPIWRSGLDAGCDYFSHAWRVQINDWGCGFDAASAEATHRSIGLFGMRERARPLNGELTIESHPGTGTRILAELFF